MTPRGRHVLAGAMALTVAGLAAPALADIFTYVDENGVLHVSNKPKGDGRFKLFVKGQKAERGGDDDDGQEPAMPGDRTPERFTRYDDWIRQAASLYQIPEALVRAVIKVESDYDPRATSPVGAQGLMQLMPETALRMQVRDRQDPRENIFGGTRYLRVLANQLQGNLELTIAAYNAGEGAVLRYGGVPPYAETQHYVGEVLGYYRRYRASDDAQAASR